MGERENILKDKMFWLRLEFIASGWFATSEAKELRRFWIDGFNPLSFKNTQRGMDIEGIARVVETKKAYHQFPFCVSVPQKLLHRTDPAFLIESLVLDEAGKSLTIVLAPGSDL